MINEYRKIKPSHADLGYRLFDSQCKVALRHLEPQIEQAFIKAVMQTGNLLTLFAKSQANRSFFMDSQQLLKNQSPGLLDSGDYRFTLPISGPEPLSPFKQQLSTLEQLNTTTLKRLKVTANKNFQNSLRLYRSLLEERALLNHFKTAPQMIQTLLHASPEHCKKIMHARLRQSTADQYWQSEFNLIISFILSSYFFTNLGEVYKNLETQIQLYSSDQLTHQKTTHLETKPTWPQASIENNTVPHKNHEAFQVIPVQINQNSAIQRQIFNRSNNELAARALLKQMPIGTFINWLSSNHNRKTQLLKLINHDTQTQSLVFANEVNGRFVRYSLDTLVQAYIAGNLKQISKKNKAQQALKKSIQRYFSST